MLEHLWGFNSLKMNKMAGTSPYHLDKARIWIVKFQQ